VHSFLDFDAKLPFWRQKMLNCQFYTNIYQNNISAPGVTKITACQRLITDIVDN
jgi:hypothetical protein